MKPAFWKSKRVLITGHTGFKGSWLALWLQKAGAEVSGYSLEPPSSPNLYEAARIDAGMFSVQGDVRDLEYLRAVMAGRKPEIVIHMAAQSLVRHSYISPVDTYATNVMGTVNVLEAVRQTPSARVVIVVTSDKCYENEEWVWGYREDERMGGHDPYSSSKGCAELVTAAYRKSFFQGSDADVCIASVRAGNVIGGGDWAKDRLIPDAMRAFMDGRRVVVRSPNAIRPWQHVLEPLSGYLILAEKLWEERHKFAQAWNFGPNEDDAKPVSWIVDRLAQMWGQGAGWEPDRSRSPHEAHYLKLDCSKAKAELKWHPSLNLDTALELVTEWYVGYFNKADVRLLTEKQIDLYQSRICR